MKLELKYVILDNRRLMRFIYGTKVPNENYLKIIGYITTDDKVRWLLPWEATISVNDALKKETRSEEHESTWNTIKIPVNGTTIVIPYSCAPREKRITGKAKIINGNLLEVTKYL